MSASYQTLSAGLSELGLKAMHDGLDGIIDEVNAGRMSFTDGLNELVSRELARSRKKRTETIIASAHFLNQRTFEQFDFPFQPELRKDEVLDLKDLRFMDDGSNVMFIGLPGVGKTHLAIATGIAAAEKGKTVYFITCHDLLENLRKSRMENRLEYRMRHYASYSLLIIDEVGYLPVDREDANMLFQLIARRYERKSTIVTTNISLSKWGDMFGDAMVANAILDRLLHHSKVFTIKGRSYRTKDYTEKEQGAKQ